MEVKKCHLGHLHSIAECLGFMSQLSTSDSSFLLGRPGEAVVIVQIVGSLAPTGETWVEFSALGFPAFGGIW